MQRDITGQKYGKLTVLSFSHIDEHRAEIWTCKCDCGVIKTYRKWNLEKVDHPTRSCGCSKQKFPSPESGARAFYRMLLHGAKMRSKPIYVQITKEEAYNLSQKSCHYCGSVPKQVLEDVKNFFYNGIDRVDNSRGYFIDNCVPCCGICNRMKHVLKRNDFLDHCRMIVNHCNFNTQSDISSH